MGVDLLNRAVQHFLVWICRGKCKAFCFCSHGACTPKFEWESDRIAESMELLNPRESCIFFFCFGLKRKLRWLKKLSSKLLEILGKKHNFDKKFNTSLLLLCDKKARNSQLRTLQSLLLKPREARLDTGDVIKGKQKQINKKFLRLFHKSPRMRKGTPSIFFLLCMSCLSLYKSEKATEFRVSLNCQLTFVLAWRRREYTVPLIAYSR